MPTKASRYVTAYESIFAKADQEGRDLSAEERGEVEALLSEAEGAHKLEQRLKGLDGDLTAKFERDGSGDGSGHGGPGDRFVRSAGYKAIQDPNQRASKFSSGLVEVSDAPLGAKGTLLEPGAGGPGGGLVPPQWEPGVVSKLFNPLGVGDLFGQSATTASEMRYVNEGTATSGATGVAEGAAKPQSTLSYAEVKEPIKKVATSLVVSDEMLEDAASIQSYLNERLSLFIQIEEERQLLVGGGTNELAGLTGRAGINTYKRGTVDNNAIALLKVMAGCRGSSFLEPDAIIMNPANWLSTRLLADSTGQFLGGGPFNNSSPVPNSAFSAAPLWGARVVTSSIIGAGTAIVGSFQQGAHIWRRGGVNVEATNSHEDYFVKDLVALRAESRLGLGVFRPSAFCVVSELS